MSAIAEDNNAAFVELGGGSYSHEIVPKPDAALVTEFEVVVAKRPVCSAMNTAPIERTMIKHAITKINRFRGL